MNLNDLIKKLDLWDEPSPFQNREARNQKQHNWDALRRWCNGFTTSLNKWLGNTEDRINDQLTANTFKDEEIDFRRSDMLEKTFETMRLRGNFFDQELASRGINVKWFGAVGDGAADDTGAIQTAINFARECFIDREATNTVIIPQGEYLITKTIEIPPYVKVKSQGNVRLLTDSIGTLIWIKYNDEDTPEMIAKYERNEFTRAPILNGFDGGLNLMQTGEARGGIALMIGDETDRTSSLPVSRFSINNISINGFGIGVKFNTFNVYLGTFSTCHLETNDINVQFGDADHEDVTNSGENMIFNDCLFAGAKQSFLWMCDGFNCNFNNCSMDFNEVVFYLKRGWKMINYLGGHIEGCPQISVYDSVHKSDIYFKHSNQPSLNVDGTVIFCNPNTKYMFEVINQEMSMQVSFRAPRMIITKPSTINYYLCDAKIETLVNGFSTQSEYVVPFSENLNPVQAWYYQDHSKFVIKSGAGVKGEFTTTNIPEAKFGEVFKASGTGETLNPWTTLTSAKFNCVSRSRLFGQVIYYSESATAVIETKVYYYNLSGELIKTEYLYENYITKNLNNWSEFSLLGESIPNEAVTCGLEVTISRVDAGKNVMIGPLMINLI